MCPPPCPLGAGGELSPSTSSMYKRIYIYMKTSLIASDRYLVDAPGDRVLQGHERLHLPDVEQLHAAHPAPNRQHHICRKHKQHATSGGASNTKITSADENGRLIIKCNKLNQSVVCVYTKECRRSWCSTLHSSYCKCYWHYHCCYHYSCSSYNVRWWSRYNAFKQQHFTSSYFFGVWLVMIIVKQSSLR